jgi:hypothetical protein
VTREDGPPAEPRAGDADSSHDRKGTVRPVARSLRKARPTRTAGWQFAAVQYSNFEHTLEVITAAAMGGIPGADHAGIALVVGRQKVESRPATDELPGRWTCLGLPPVALGAHETVRIDELGTGLISSMTTPTSTTRRRIMPQSACGGP